jgi:hypothetical protein
MRCARDITACLVPHLEDVVDDLLKWHGPSLLPGGNKSFLSQLRSGITHGLLIASTINRR